MNWTYETAGLAFNDEVSNPPYELFIAGTNMTVTNLNNHGANGHSHVKLTGKFMGQRRDPCRWHLRSQRRRP